MKRHINNAWGHLFFKRFFFILFILNIHRNHKKLYKVIDEINKIHLTIKFTTKHTTPKKEAEEDSCNCARRRKNAVPFLATLVTIEDKQIETDLYRKPTDGNKYLLPDSCHADTCNDNIHYSLFLRITRIC